MFGLYRDPRILGNYHIDGQSANKQPGSRYCQETGFQYDIRIEARHLLVLKGSGGVNVGTIIEVCISLGPHPVIVTTRGNGNYIRVLIYS